MPRAAAARTAVTALPSEVTGTIADSAATTTGLPFRTGTVAPLGVCPLRLTGTDTDMLYAGAAARAERFLR